MADRIKSIQLTPVFMPFKDVVKDAMQSGEGHQGMVIPTEEPWQGGEALICQMDTDGGYTGLGEVLIWLPESGANLNQMMDIIQKPLGKYVIGEDPFNVERMRVRMENNVALNDIAKGLLDMACYDLMGQISGRPVYDLLGGKCLDHVPLAALVPLGSVDSMVTFAKLFSGSGYSTIRYKLGLGAQKDFEISQALREALGPDTRLRVDYNQAYQPAEAVRAIRKIEPLGIDVAEQPVEKNDVLGMRYVQERAKTPIMSHEGCFSTRDYISLVEMGAVKAIGINAEHPGGITSALRMINYAAFKNLGVIIHTQSLGITSAALAHVAAVKYPFLGHAPELFGTFMFEDDLIRTPLDYNKGKLKVPAGPGWGVKLDQTALLKYAAGSPLLLKK